MKPVRICSRPATFSFMETAAGAKHKTAQIFLGLEQLKDNGQGHYGTKLKWAPIGLMTHFQQKLGDAIITQSPPLQWCTQSTCWSFGGVIWWYLTQALDHCTKALASSDRFQTFLRPLIQKKKHNLCLDFTVLNSIPWTHPCCTNQVKMLLNCELISRCRAL